MLLGNDRHMPGHAADRLFTCRNFESKEHQTVTESTLLFSVCPTWG
jgi:hypothetical protein